MYAHLAGQALRAGWYFGLHELTDRVTSALGQKPPAFKPTGPVPSMQTLIGDVAALLMADARNVRDGLYPAPEGEDGPLLRHLDRARAMLQDLPAAVRRRAAGDGREVAREDHGAGLPDYFLQNFHYQSGGYLSEESARLYDIQVETLFIGAANAMRRQALVPVAEFVRGRDQRALRLLDVACGTGAFLRQTVQAFPAIRAIGLDLSRAYLGEARRLLRRRRRTALVQANGEALPVADASQDIVTCIFLFHELPAPVRRKVTREVARVLKPGGLFVFIDSLQLGDRRSYDGLLEAFPAKFHEPYYRHYLSDDLDGVFADAGLAPQSQATPFLAKLMARRKSG